MDAEAPRGARERHVAITGASSGIGAALAVRFAGAGVRLTLFGRDEARLKAVAARCEALGSTVRGFAADVADEEPMHQLLTRADGEAPIDMIIANAGIGGGAAMACAAGEDVKTASLILRTNVLGVVHAVAPLLPRFAARRKGHIVIVGSLAGFAGLPDSPAYSASKAAVRVYGQGLRRLLAASGVKVSVVSPGFVDTPMSASLPFRGPFTWSAERAAAHIAGGLERGKPEIIFPLPLALAAGLVSLMPVRAADWVLERFRGGSLWKRSDAGPRKRDRRAEKSESEP